MSSRSIQVDGLRPAQVRAVEARAVREGKTASEYVRGLIERDLLARRTFDAILAPVRADVRARGLTEADFDALVTKARRAVARKRGGAGHR